MTLEDKFEKLWTQYPRDLCKGKRGGRQPAFKAFKKINPDDTEFERIMANMKAMIRADKSDPDAYRWPFVSSYLNQARYDDFIAPATERTARNLKTCCVEGCRQDVHGSSFQHCSTHIPNAHGEEIKQAWIRTGIDTKSPTLTDDCREYCRSRMNLWLNK